jgi:hypothetical protein
MTRIPPLRFILTGLLILINHAEASSLVQHDIQVELNIDKQHLHVIDRIELGELQNREFLLHGGLKPRSLTPGVTIKQQGAIPGPITINVYQVSMPEEQHAFTLEYDGVISHQLTRSLESPGRSREHLPGTISSDGVYLDARVAWYPYFQESLQAFAMKVSLPLEWLAVSQGEGPVIDNLEDRVQVSWRETQPQDDIYLVAGPYQLYRKVTDGVEAQIFLYQADHPLAQRYLNATAHYLTLYQQLIGTYPYAKFALVENFWETGYGMPSFTLLGPRVLRLPFILHTSYPHEILHNWWGNSVYIDYSTGNWAEGLTNYLADHLLAEQSGRGHHYRRDQLQSYRDFIREENDFPLNRFRSRHGSASQAVGYGKSLMLFHMLRRHLGDEVFIDGLQRFYRNNRFKTAGFKDLQQAFEEAGNTSLDIFFEPWITRTGAPSISLQKLKLDKTPVGYRIHGNLRQNQASPPFPIEVPLLIHQQHQQPRLVRIAMNKRETSFNIDLNDRPVQVDVDPWFDLFRDLYPEETPPTLSTLFGNERLMILIPAKAPKPFRQAYEMLANRWSEGYAGIEIALDETVDQLPEDRPVYLLGWENSHLDTFLNNMDPYPFTRQTELLTIDETSYPVKGHSFTLVRRDSVQGESRAWVASDSPQSIPGLARKLPHYGKYSYLVFSGKNPNNVLKGQWPVTTSPLRKSLSEQTGLREAPQPAPLVRNTNASHSQENHH